MISVLGVMILLFSMLELKYIETYRIITPIILFIIYILVISINSDLSMAYAESILKYMIPFLGVFSYCRKTWDRFWKIGNAILLACVFLAIAIIQKGTVSYDGAVQLGTLNINQASNFLTFGLVILLLKIDVYNKNKKRNIILILLGVILNVSQIISASRRGFIIMIFLIFMYVTNYFVIILKKNRFARLMGVIIIFTIIAFVYSSYSNVFSSMTVMQRLSGVNTTGDLARSRYQAIALQIFLNNPICGKGLGAVEKVAGAYSHSLYFELLACTGIIGIVIVMGTFASMLIKLRYLRKNEIIDSDKCITAFMSAYVISILLSSITMVFIYESYFYIMLAVVFSYIVLAKETLCSDGEMKI